MRGLWEEKKIKTSANDTQDAQRLKYYMMISEFVPL